MTAVAHVPADLQAKLRAQIDDKIVEIAAGEIVGYFGNVEGRARIEGKIVTVDECGREFAASLDVLMELRGRLLREVGGG